MNNPPHTAYDSQTDPVLNRPHFGRRFIVAILAALVIALVIVWRRGNGETDQNAETAPELSASTIPTAEPKRPATVRTIAEGDLPADLFLECGYFDANDTAAILSSAEDVFDLSRLRIGRELRFFFEDGDARAVRMEYDRDTERKVVVSRDGDAFTAQEEPIAYELTQETAAGTIDNFFYVDAMDAGLSEATVLEVADLFAFDVDFTTDIRIGDSFVIVYEKRRRNGTDASDGRILAAKFVNAGTPFFAYRFETEGRGRYYDAEGRELERQFLKAPLSYRKITSGFTGARLHPITKTVTAHYQIDYAAPVGTPVVASARGTVSSAGWEGGWGNIVRLTHDNGYTTHYGHLSAFAEGIRSNIAVERGEVIGYVGSTGWSTGPHLDYGMRLNGSPVNPLTLDLPKGAPLSGAAMDAFQESRADYEKFLR